MISQSVTVGGKNYLGTKTHNTKIMSDSTLTYRWVCKELWGPFLILDTSLSEHETVARTISLPKPESKHTGLNCHH